MQFNSQIAPSSSLMMSKLLLFIIIRRNNNQTQPTSSFFSSSSKLRKYWKIFICSMLCNINGEVDFLLMMIKFVLRSLPTTFSFIFINYFFVLLVATTWYYSNILVRYGWYFRSYPYQQGIRRRRL